MGLRNAYFGPGVVPVVLDELICTGFERTLLECEHEGIGMYYEGCYHSDDASVRCQGNVPCYQSVLFLNYIYNINYTRIF